MSDQFSITIVASGAEDWQGQEDVDECPVFLIALNKWLSDRGMFGLVQLDGVPHRSIGAYICAGQNRGSLPEGFVGLFQGFPWRCPEKVVAVILPEDGLAQVMRPIQAPTFMARIEVVEGVLRDMYGLAKPDDVSFLEMQVPYTAARIVLALDEHK